MNDVATKLKVSEKMVGEMESLVASGDLQLQDSKDLFQAKFGRPFRGHDLALMAAHAATDDDDDDLLLQNMCSAEVGVEYTE